MMNAVAPIQVGDMVEVRRHLAPTRIVAVYGRVIFARPPFYIVRDYRGWKYPAMAHQLTPVGARGLDTCRDHELT